MTKLIWWQAHCLIPSIWIPNLPSYEQMAEHILPCLISCWPGMDSWSLYAAEYTLCYQKSWAPASLNRNGRPHFSLKLWFHGQFEALSLSLFTAEFEHLAEPRCICSPFSVHVWDPNGFVFEPHTFTEQKSSGITQYIACDSHMQLVTWIKSIGKDAYLLGGTLL